MQCLTAVRQLSDGAWAYSCLCGYESGPITWEHIARFSATAHETAFGPQRTVPMFCLPTKNQAWPVGPPVISAILTYGEFVAGSAVVVTIRYHDEQRWPKPGRTSCMMGTFTNIEVMYDDRPYANLVDVSMISRSGGRLDLEAVGIPCDHLVVEN